MTEATPFSATGFGSNNNHEELENLNRTKWQPAHSHDTTVTTFFGNRMVLTLQLHNF